MEKLSLQVVIGGRTYPLKVNVGEEIQIQKAAEDINRAIRLLQENYAVKDMQDLLAMTALQLATKPTNSSIANKIEADYSAVEDKLDGLLKELDSLK